jgi:hypothetical protein
LTVRERVHPDLGEVLPVEEPDLVALRGLDDARCRVGQRGGYAAFEHVRRLDDVIVDGDDRVLHLPRQRLGQEQIGGGRHSGAPLRRPR